MSVNHTNKLPGKLSPNSCHQAKLWCQQLFECQLVVTSRNRSFDLIGQPLVIIRTRGWLDEI